jgi:hypothetical protein
MKHRGGHPGLRAGRGVSALEMRYPTRESEFYFGLHLGGTVTSATWTDPFSMPSDDPKASSALGGAEFGVNWQTENWVYGPEVSASWLELGGTAVDAAAFSHLIRAHWLATATGRLGYAFDQYLV